MAFKRYANRIATPNNSVLIEKILKNKNLKFIKHYTSPNFKIPTVLEKENINTTTIYWKSGDRLYKYAEQYYQNAELWWIIGLYNNKPTDAHYKIGDLVYIPLDLEQLMLYMEI